jgi:hypothetical protein
MVKKLKSIVQSVYHNRYYLIANKHLLKKLIFVFRDVCILTLFLRIYDIPSHHSIFLLNTPLKVAEQGRNMEDGYNMFVYYCLQL